MYIFKVALVLSAVAAVAYSQALTCSIEIPVPPEVCAEGEAESVADVALTCTGGTPSASTPINVTLTLNTNLTSRTFATMPVASEALLLIDEPQPNAVNISNGFSYNGQVFGTPFVVAGTSGIRFFRITNIRANATAVAANPYAKSMPPSRPPCPSVIQPRLSPLSPLV